MKVIGPGVRAGRRGLMLAECMLALVILPLAVAAVAYAVVAGQAQAAEALHQARAAALADALMEEILSLPYQSSVDNALGPEEGNRWSFDSPTDYHGFSEAADAIKWLDRLAGQETAYPSGLQSFERSASVSFCECGGGGPGACSSDLCEAFGPDTPITGKILAVSVTVSDASGQDVVTVERMIIEEPE